LFSQLPEFENSCSLEEQVLLAHLELEYERIACGSKRSFRLFSKLVELEQNRVTA
jgi:hypothetical protein